MLRKPRCYLRYVDSRLEQRVELRNRARWIAFGDAIGDSDEGIEREDAQYIGDLAGRKLALGRICQHLIEKRKGIPQTAVGALGNDKCRFIG